MNFIFCEFYLNEKKNNSQYFGLRNRKIKVSIGGGEEGTSVGGRLGAGGRGQASGRINS